MIRSFPLSRAGKSADLARMIEPLASYICATDQPRTALQVALAALCEEVDQTSQAASAFATTFSEHHRS